MEKQKKQLAVAFMVVLVAVVAIVQAGVCHCKVLLFGQ